MTTIARWWRGESRGAGWEFVHVLIEDASRIAFSRILPDERKESATAFLRAAVAWYASLGVEVARVMTDNGSCYRSKAFRDACRDPGLRRLRTRPHTPRTNGKAERFIQTALRERPTPGPARTRTAAPRSCPSGSTDTTGVARTAAYNHDHPSAASDSSRTTC